LFPIRDTIPSRRTPFVTWALVLINAAVFAYELSLHDPGIERLFREHALIPARLSQLTRGGALLEDPGAVLTLVTSMFLHGGWLHVIGNLWTLLIFGDNVEDRMGPLRYLAFYLVCGVAAGVTHVSFDPGSLVPTIGASGAIAGVMGAYFLLYPRARVITIVPIFFYPLFVEIPAVVYLGFWFASQVFSGTLSVSEGPQEAGGVAFLAHVGGFLAGLLLHRLFLRRPRGRG